MLSPGQLEGELSAPLEELVERLPSVLLEEGQGILSVPIQEDLAETQSLFLGDTEC